MRLCDLPNLAAFVTDDGIFRKIRLHGNYIEAGDRHGEIHKMYPDTSVEPCSIMLKDGDFYYVADAGMWTKDIRQASTFTWDEVPDVAATWTPYVKVHKIYTITPLDTDELAQYGGIWQAP